MKERENEKERGGKKPACTFEVHDIDHISVSCVCFNVPWWLNEYYVTTQYINTGLVV